jgi:hypothetical protein
MALIGDQFFVRQPSALGVSLYPKITKAQLNFSEYDYESSWDYDHGGGQD